MNKKIFLWLFVLISLISYIYADCTTIDNVRAYWSYDSDCISDDATSTYTLTNNGADNVAGGILGNACDFEVSENDYLQNDSVSGSWVDTAGSTCLWVKMESTADQQFINFGDAVTQDYVLMRLTSDNFVSETYPNLNKVTDSTNRNTDVDWHHLCMTWDASAHINKFYVDGSSIGSASSNSPILDSVSKFHIGVGWWAGSRVQYFDGLIDEVIVTTDELSVAEIGDLYNSGSACNPYSLSEDVTPPTITNINQEPENLTSLNAVTSELKINATITDNVLLNLSSIKLRINLTHIEQYVLGEDITISQREIDYTSNGTNYYNWELEENYYLSYTANLPFDYWSTAVIENNTLSSGNQWLKIKFYNVTNDARLMFTEIMDTNNTGISEYYYCNINYTTGSPVSNEWCTQFHVQSDTDLFHSHDTQWHRLMPMNVNTTSGTLNGIGVTQESYILKKGSGTGETYFYTNNDTSTTQTTNNNGNSWSSQLYTVNAHIHQIHEQEYFEYSICAEDNETNRACSGNFTEQVDYPIIPPFPSQFETPVFNGTYNTSIQIEYTKATSLTATPIKRYTLEYKAEDDTSWTTIIQNNYPNTDYNWNIENRLNGIYYLRITAEDENNLTAITISPLFNINNPVGQDIQLLTDILAEEEQQTTTINNIYEVLNMLWYVILNLGILTAGFYLTLNYNHQFGIPYIFAGNLMMFKYIIDSFGWGTWIGYIFVGLIFVSIMAMFSMKSIRNRVLFHKK